MRWIAALGLLAGCAGSHVGNDVEDATTPPIDAPLETRRLTIELVPTSHLQLAIWIEAGDVFETLYLTRSVGLHGIGNRPGALQMNSGPRWPYGRREHVLPVWAHRRVDAGGEAFRRVVFWNRASEGHTEQSGDPPGSNNPDPWACLSFTDTLSRIERLFEVDRVDAITCPSLMNDDRGRYLAAGETYVEPFEDGPGEGRLRTLDAESLYPPRRSAEDCGGAICMLHEDATHFDDDALDAMPELDAITQATPLAEATLTLDEEVRVPEGAELTVFVEANREADFNDVYSLERAPTPTTPEDAWDYWAQTYGSPTRGQPSVVYRVTVRDGTSDVAAPVGSGAFDGQDGELHALDGITDDPDGAPGSGADRVFLRDGRRVRVTLR